MQRTTNFFLSIVMFWVLSASVEGAPIVRDHRKSAPSGSLAGLVVRDHRQPNPVPGGSVPPWKLPPGTVTPVKNPPTKLPPWKLPPGTVTPVKKPPTKLPPWKLPPGTIPPVKDPPTKLPPWKLPPGTIPPVKDPPACPVPPPCDPPTDGGCSKPCFPWGQFVGGFVPFGGFGGFGGSGDSSVYVDNSVAVSEPEPVAEAPVAQPQADDVLRLYPGMELSISGADFGAAEGKVAIKVGDLIMLAEIVDWQPEAVVVRLPVMLIARPLPAELMVKRADRTMAREVPFELAQGEGQ